MPADQRIGGSRDREHVSALHSVIADTSFLITCATIRSCTVSLASSESARIYFSSIVHGVPAGPVPESDSKGVASEAGDYASTRGGER